MWKRTSLLIACSSILLVANARPLKNLQVTLRGHKYEVSDVETVAELQQELKKTSGVDPKQQGRVLFGGKRLTSDTSLEDAGVSDGASLNLVPGKTSTKKTSKPSVSAPAAASSASTSSSSDTSSDMNAQLNEFMKSMGAGDGDGAPPNMEEAMAQMGNMMNSPIFQEFMSDPEKLEQSRQMILSNPLLKSMMAGMPGMEEMLNDPVAWREAMQAAANLYRNMDPADLMKAMMGEGGGGMPSGMLDGLDSTPMAALDELSEGED
jgi:hypothetical protein